MIVDTKLGNRSVYLPRGRDPLEDLNLLADTIAASAADLFEQDDCVVWIASGRCIPVTPEVLREIIKLFITTKHPREREGVYDVEFRVYEPEEKTLHALLMAKRREDGSLMARLPKGPRTLSPAQQREARERLQRGEPAARVAYAFGADVAMIRQLAAS